VGSFAKPNRKQQSQSNERPIHDIKHVDKKRHRVGVELPTMRGDLPCYVPNQKIGSLSFSDV
jgi:hypothetical protein